MLCEARALTSRIKSKERKSPSFIAYIESFYENCLASLKLQGQQ